MSVEAFVGRIIQDDKAVYWASPVATADGSLDYDAGTEINCFWVNMVDHVIDDQGKEFLADARVHVIQDLDEGGMLYHGILTDLTVAQRTDPKQCPDSYQIKGFKKMPSMQNPKTYGRVALLMRSKRR